MERKVSYHETTGMSTQSLKVKESRVWIVHPIYKQISPVQNMHKIRKNRKGKKNLSTIVQCNIYNLIHY